jgi:hypothetical protein
MLSIVDLSPELWLAILTLLPVSDLKAVRLVNKIGLELAPQFMILEVYFAPRKVILNLLIKITSHTSFALGVKKVRFGYLQFPEQKLILY